MSLRLALPFGVALVVAASCSLPQRLPDCVEAPPDGGRTIATGGDPVLLAAGDIVDPSTPEGSFATERLLAARNGLVAALGDEVNADQPILDDYLDVYATTWGRERWRTKPAVGNHDYRAPNAAPYFAYFCAAAGTPFEGWYSYDLGAWHVVVLNSQCVDPEDHGAPGCGRGSAQWDWLAADLAAHASGCTLAYWHHARFSSSPVDGDHPGLTDIWQTLELAGVDVVLNGHSHHYERYAPQTPDGVVDEAGGIRQFVVGTGGAALEYPETRDPNSEVMITGVWGILVLTLHSNSYDWQFVDVDGATRDQGTGLCHSEVAVH